MSEKTDQTKFAERTSETDNCVFHLVRPGIIVSRYHPNSVESIDHARQNIAACQQLCEGRKWAAVVDLKNVNSVSREVRAFYAYESPRYNCRAIAFLSGSYLSQLVANFFIQFNSPLLPVKAFSSEAKAIEWIIKKTQATDD